MIEKVPLGKLAQNEKEKEGHGGGDKFLLSSSSLADVMYKKE
jgi:hypothetical protein